MVSCSEDNPATPVTTIKSPFSDLSQEDHVIQNFVTACTQENLLELDRLLAVDFRFYFWTYEVTEGFVDSVSWGRSAELTAVEHLFDSASAFQTLEVVAASRLVAPTWGVFKASYLLGVPSWPGAARVVEVAIQDFNDEWMPMASPQGRYFKDIAYHFEVEGEKTEYPIDLTGLARIVIERQEIDGRSVWQLVEWHDNYGVR